MLLKLVAATFALAFLSLTVAESFAGGTCVSRRMGDGSVVTTCY